MPMLRNIDSRFSQAPMDLEMERSAFDRDFDHKTTFNAGDLVPIFCDEVLPGDTFDLSTNYVARMSTPVFPVMDNAYLETFFFFVPNRLVWDHWKEFNGENNTSYWTQPTEYNVPQIRLVPLYNGDKIGAQRGSVADYMGIPTGIAAEDGSLTVNALPFRAYAKIWNDWFRDQNVMQPAFNPTDDSDRDIGDAGIRGRLSACVGGQLLKVSKYHDYFTSALPGPQKGPDVSVGGSFNFSSNVPVVTGSIDHYGSQNTMRYKFLNSNAFSPYENFNLRVGRLNSNSSSVGILTAETGNSVDSRQQELLAVTPSNLYADLVSSASGDVSLFVNDIRLAFQLQRLYERDARGGTRYIEVIKSHFGVDSPDGRLQRSEYLGGSRQPINISQVLQTSSTDETSPLGNTAAFSLTSGSDSSFIKSFTEHGWIIGLACVRTDQTYQQGINKMFSRKRRFDYYWPALANIGEQPILRKEILASGTSDDDEAFGYQEAWAEYRYHPSQVSGAFRSNVQGSLDSWHYANYYDPSTHPYMIIDESFVTEGDQNIDRTLAVQSSLEDQFIADFYFKCRTTRVMPLYSIPGLIDHH